MAEPRKVDLLVVCARRGASRYRIVVSRPVNEACIEVEQQSTDALGVESWRSLGSKGRELPLHWILGELIARRWLGSAGIVGEAHSLEGTQLGWTNDQLVLYFDLGELPFDD